MRADCRPRLGSVLVAGAVALRRSSTLAGAVLALLLPACDSAGGDRPAFRVDITGAAEATLTGRPFVGVGALEPDLDLYTFVLSEGVSSVTFGVEGRPAPRSYPVEGAFVIVTATDGPAFFTATDGTVTVESVDGSMVRLRLAFDAVNDAAGGAEIRVEGTAAADLDGASRFPNGPPGRGGALVQND